MKHKIDSLTGAALDFAVASVLPLIASAVAVTDYGDGDEHAFFQRPVRNPDDDEDTLFASGDQWWPSRDWNQAGPLIREHCISILWRDGSAAGTNEPYWWACVAGDSADEEQTGMTGATPLEAAMRALLSHLLANGHPDAEVTEVEIPTALDTQQANRALQQMVAESSPQEPRYSF